MMEGFGYQKKLIPKMILKIFQNMKETIFWKDNILNMGIWFPEMSPLEEQERSVKKVLVLVLVVKEYILTYKTQ